MLWPGWIWKEYSTPFSSSLMTALAIRLLVQVQNPLLTTRDVSSAAIASGHERRPAPCGAGLSKRDYFDAANALLM
jgi:hypothetical protein